MGAGLESQSRRDSVLEELGRSVCWDLVEGSRWSVDGSQTSSWAGAVSSQ